MAVGAVDRQTQQFRIELLELIGHAGEGHELGRTHRGEVGRVREEDHPLALIVLREVDSSLRGLGDERRRLLANQRHSVLLLFHC